MSLYLLSLMSSLYVKLSKTRGFPLFARAPRASSFLAACFYLSSISYYLSQ